MKKRERRNRGVTRRIVSRVPTLALEHNLNTADAFVKFMAYFGFAMSNSTALRYLHETHPARLEVDIWGAFGTAFKRELHDLLQFEPVVETQRSVCRRGLPDAPPPEVTS